MFPLIDPLLNLGSNATTNNFLGTVGAATTTTATFAVCGLKSQVIYSNYISHGY